MNDRWAEVSDSFMLVRAVLDEAGPPDSPSWFERLREEIQPDPAGAPLDVVCTMLGRMWGMAGLQDYSAQPGWPAYDRPAEWGERYWDAIEGLERTLSESYPVERDEDDDWHPA